MDYSKHNQNWLEGKNVSANNQIKRGGEKHPWTIAERKSFLEYLKKKK
jgi:hypothetical protein